MFIDSAIIEEKPFLPQIKTEPKEESESTDTTSFECMIVCTYALHC